MKRIFALVVPFYGQQGDDMKALSGVRTILISFLFLVAASSLAPGQDAQIKDFEIRLQRAPRLGTPEKVSAVASFQLEERIRANGRETRTDVEFQIEFEANRRVLRVNRIGREEETAYTISTCVKKTKTGRETLVEPGRVLTVEVEDGTHTFRQDEGALSEDVVATLRELFPDGSKAQHHVSDDAAFGTRERQQIGGRWPIHAETVAAELGDSLGGPVRKESIEGNVTLAGTARVGRMDCLRIKGDMTIQSPPTKAPEGMEVESHLIESQFELIYPIDTERECLFSSALHRYRIRMKGKGSPNDSFHGTLIRSREWKRIPAEDESKAGK